MWLFFLRVVVYSGPGKTAERKLTTSSMSIHHRVRSVYHRVVFYFKILWCLCYNYVYYVSDKKLLDLSVFLQSPLSAVQGGLSFNSGRPVPRNSFLYTFDDPGTFCVASQGAPGFACTIKVLNEG